MLFEETCGIGDIILIKEGKQDKLIAHTRFGKVMIPVNKVKCGYAKIIEIVKVSEKYILIKAENVVKDYYDKIPYEEFKEVLKINGYKIGFDRPFESEFGIEHHLLAYNLDNGIVLVAETFYGSETFNSIKVYCPNVNGLGIQIPMESQASSTMTILDLCYGRNFEFPIQWMHRLVENKSWDSRDDISLWTYADSNDKTERRKGKKYGFEAYSLWEDTIDRLLLADKEIELILGNCKRLKPVFETRKDSIKI